MKMSTKRLYENENKYDEEFCYFLVKRINRNGGSIQFQHLTGHLSGLPPEVRNSVGTTMPELKSFLKKHNDIFNVHGDMVSLSKPSVTEEKDYSDTDSIESKTSLPDKIMDGIGVIVRLFPEYGFIKTKEPVKTSVFFRPSHMGYKKDTNLMECGINIGTMVSFHARKERNQQQFTSKYCAIKVWKNKTIDGESIQKPRKKLETGLYDPLKLEGEGVIQKVFPNLGFIAVDGKENNTVFFHKNRLVNYENIVDLTKFLSRGDVMEFCAHRSTKQDVTARWEATKVWKKSGKSISSKRPENTACQSNGIQTRPSSDSGLGENDSQSALNVKHQIAKNEIIRNQKGKICPRSHGAVIKFGDDLSKLADGDSSIYFNYGAKVLDVGWEFDEGDDVLFDAVKIKSAPGWKATLVWVGEKPDTHDSTFDSKFSELTDEEIEIPDENDSSVSCNFYPMSSNSSVKSESTTSKPSNYNKAKTDCFVDNEVKNSNQKNKSSLFSSSRSSSQNSLSSFVDAKVFQKSRRELREKSSTREHNFKERKKESNENSMYADDNTSSSKENISDIVSSGHSGSQDDDDDNDLKTALDYLKTKDKDASLEGNNVKKMSKNTELNPENTHNTKRKGSIKKYQNVHGKILQVFSTFAKVESSKLLKPIGFFSSVFYCNRKSPEELELSNLKEVLNVGDTVYFNYFEIVDDSGQNWCKVTMAWKGAKPIAPFQVELTPEDFIKQNDLPFTIKQQTTSYKEVEEITSKKFLTSFEDITPDCETAECASLTESCMDNEEILQPENLKLEKSEIQAEKSEIEASLEELPSRISEILRNKEFTTDLQVDLNILAADIINLVLEDCASKRSRQNSLKDFLPSEMRSEKLNSDVCSSCGKNVTEKLCNQDSNVTDVEVQTIITGDVMAQNIFTDC